MISISAAWEAMPLSLTRWKEKMAALGSGVQRKRVTSALFVVGWLAVGCAMILIAMATLQLSLPRKSPTASLAVATQPKKRSLSTATTASCSGEQANSVAAFAVCPTFTQDYTNKVKGMVDTQIFNVYTGKPEGNQEAQLYTGSTQNLRVENGSLVLQAQNQVQQGFKYTSARIDTKGKEDFLYGKITVRAMMPKGIGTWPAIWMLPSQSKYASMSPASDPNRYLNDGELDIAEAVGTEPGRVYGIAHSLAYPETGVAGTYFDVTTVPNNDSTYHEYGLEWTPTSVTFTVDGKAYYTMFKKAGADYRSWPYDQPFYLVLNLAMGGNWGGTDKAHFPGDGVDKSALPASLKIQSVRYYPYIGPR